MIKFTVHDMKERLSDGECETYDMGEDSEGRHHTVWLADHSHDTWLASQLVQSRQLVTQHDKTATSLTQLRNIDVFQRVHLLFKQQEAFFYLQKYKRASQTGPSNYHKDG